MKVSQSIVCTAALALFLSLSSVAQAGVSVGDQVNLQYKTVTGQAITSEQLKGKLVVLDFWATWCGPCMQMVPHMVEMNSKYTARGVVFLGVSLDQDRGAMLQVTKQQGMSWPEYFDGLGWDNRLWKQYGSNGIPYTILLSPEGKVLWAGHAAGLEPQIDKALKEHPPQLVDPKLLAQAKEMLAEVQTKLDAGDTRGAIKQLAKVPAAARADGEFANSQTEVQKKLEAAATSMLDDVQKQIDSKQYSEAVGKLKDLSDALTGLPAAAKAKKMLNDLVSDPDARAAMAAAEKNTKANDALESAQKLKAQKKDELAYAQFKEIVKVYAGTDAAATAQQQVSEYEKDPAFVKRVNDKATASKAKGALAMAQNYRIAGRSDLARKKYQSVIDEFPGTVYARQAQKEISELDTK